MLNDRRGRQHEDREHRGQQGQAGHVGDGLRTPASAVAREQAAHRPVAEQQTEEYQQAELHQHLGPVVEHVVAELMGHHRADLGQRGAAEEVVVEADRRRAAQAATLALTRLVWREASKA